MSGDTMREAMEAAFDKAEIDDDEEEQEAGGSQEDSEEPLGTSGEKEEGVQLEEEQGVSGQAGEGEPTGLEAKGKVLAESSSVGDVKPDPGDPTAPVTWKPAIREHWKALPPEVKAEITRREADISKGLQQAAGHKRVAEEYFRTVSPFQHLIQAQGSTPSQAIFNLMSTAAQLTQGSPARKAEVIRNIINEYGVDIGMLDQILAGEAPAEDPNAPLYKALDERLAPITQFMGSVQQTRQQASQQMDTEAVTELSAFHASHSEFYEDLRDDMADLLEMAANRSRVMTLEQAYEQAGMAHPEIGPILSQRKAAKAGKLSADAANKKRRAASSVRGTPNAGGAEGGAGQTTRALMEELWDEGVGEVGRG